MLRTIASLAENLCTVSTRKVVVYYHLISCFPVFNYLFWFLKTPGMQAVHTHSCKQNTPTPKRKIHIFKSIEEVIGKRYPLKLMQWIFSNSRQKWLLTFDRYKWEQRRKCIKCNTSSFWCLKYVVRIQNFGNIESVKVQHWMVFEASKEDI